MSSLSSASTVILIEIAIALSAITGYMLYRFVRNNRSLNSALSGLAKKINRKRDSRQTMLKEFLEETCNYQGEEAQKTADEMIKKERMFYSTLMNIYKNRDNNALKNLDQTTEEITNAYKQLLTISAKAVAESMQHDINKKTQELSSTIDKLSGKNKELAKELSQLQHEMDMTVNEFTSAFQREQQEKQQKQGSSQPEAETNPANEQFVSGQVTSEEPVSEQAVAETVEIPGETLQASSENIDIPSTPEDAADNDSEASSSSTEVGEEEAAEAVAEIIEIAQEDDGRNAPYEETTPDNDALAELGDAPGSTESEPTAEAEPEPEPEPAQDSIKALDILGEDIAGASKDNLDKRNETLNEAEEVSAADTNSETSLDADADNKVEADNPEKDALTESLAELDDVPEDTEASIDKNDAVSVETTNDDLMEGLDDLADALDDLKTADEENKASPAA